MQTNILAYVLGTEQRKKLATALLNYPQRQWSCSSLEEVTTLPHATTFRTIKELQRFGIIKPSKINKRNVVYELVRHSLLVKELERALHLEQHNAKAIALEFSKKITSLDISAIILYGSTVRNTLKPESDIDVLIIVKKRSVELERAIYDRATALSLKYNKTISPLVMDEKEVHREKKGQFLSSVKESMEVLYGKTSF